MQPPRSISGVKSTGVLLTVWLWDGCVVSYNRSTVGVSLHPRSPLECVQHSVSRVELGECRAAAGVSWVHETGQ